MPPTSLHGTPTRHAGIPAGIIPAGIIPPRIAAGCGKAVTVVVLTLVTAIVMLIVSLAVFPASLTATRAAGMPSAQSPSPEDSNPLAGLYFPSGPDGLALEAPQVSSDVRITVNGMVARVALRQRFTNPSDSWQEGIYVFPLPERSAVDRLTMTVGGRRIVGKILEKQEARRAYDTAAAAGKRASLLSSERPNVFVTSVANIGPGEEIVIDIEYQDSASYRDGTFSLRFPMVVAPRYTPPAAAPREQPGLVANTPNRAPSRVSGADRGNRDIFGPVSKPGERVNPLTLKLVLDPGLPLKSLTSLYHDVDTEALDERRTVVTLRDGPVPADRDFVLEWRPAVGAEPEAAVFVEEFEGESYVMLMVVPPASEPHAEQLDELSRENARGAIRPRDIVFVIDTSGSMHGASLEQASAALSLAVSRLQPQDRFNVVRFDNETYSLFDELVPVTADSLRRAQAYVNALESGGGTNMRPALLRALEMTNDAALTPASQDADAPLRQVVFLTDGAVGNEAELFRLIAGELGSTRLFTVGIGSAPNSYFMRKSAEAGRGSFTYIGDPNEVSLKMSALLRKLERPALTDITLGWPGSAGKRIESYPSTLPDLYRGEPVAVFARISGVELADLRDNTLINGRQGSETWQRRAALGQPVTAQGIASLWARAKFEEITDGLHLGRDPVAVRLDALDLALRHQLVTRYTSLIAIDEQPVRPQDRELLSREVPRQLPAGWNHEKVFGDAAPGEPGLQPAPAPSMEMRRLPASFGSLAARSGTAVSLPQTATPGDLKALIGVALLVIGGAVFAAAAFRKRGRSRHA